MNPKVSNSHYTVKQCLAQLIHTNLGEWIKRFIIKPDHHHISAVKTTYTLGQIISKLTMLS